MPDQFQLTLDACIKQLKFVNVFINGKLGDKQMYVFN